MQPGLYWYVVGLFVLEAVDLYHSALAQHAFEELVLQVSVLSQLEPKQPALVPLGRLA